MFESGKMRKLMHIAATLCTLVMALAMVATICGCETRDDMENGASGNDDPISFTEPVSDITYEPETYAVEELKFPAGWTVTELQAEGGSIIPAFAKVEVLSLPEMKVEARHDGEVIPNDMMEGRDDFLAKHPTSDGRALVSYEGHIVACDAERLLVNAPDIFGDTMEYDAVYSYAAPSRSGGRDIPGLTNCKVDGYANGKQPNEYLARDEYAIPIAYGSAVKLHDAGKRLGADGYAIKIWDAYRPFSGSRFISEKFTSAYDADPAIREATGEWGLSWYAASGASGHNFATDIDLTLVDAATREEIPMPSHFDAFDGSAHLIGAQLPSSRISERDYADTVRENAACMALHQNMTEAGFSELASEWWHFGDDETETKIRSLVGGGGMDFTAR